MTDARIILRNLTANWVGFAVNLIVMFFLSPYVVHALGVTEYGIWQILTVLTGYMGILDLGVRASTGRYIILYLGKNNLVKVDETIRTGLGLYTVLSGLILFAGIVLGSAFPSIFPSVPEEYHALLRMLLPILAVNVWISAVRAILCSVLTAHERFDLARGSDLIMIAVRTIATIFVLENNLGLVGLTCAVIIFNIVGLVINYLFACRIHKNLRIWPLILEKERVKELYNYGFGAFLIAVSVRIIGQTDLILVGNLIHIDSVAVYSVGAMLLYYSGTFSKMIDRTLFPSLQKSVAQKKMNEAKYILMRQLQLSLGVSLLMYIGYFSFGKSFIMLWMFAPNTFPLASVESAAKVMAVLSCAKLLLALGGFSRSILTASGHIGFAAKIAVVEAVSNLLFSIFFVLIFNWGLTGVAAGTLVSHILFQTVIVPHYACRKAGFEWFPIFRNIGFKLIVVGGPFLLICFLIQRLFLSKTWILFFFQVGMAVLAYIPLAWFVLVPTKDRERIMRRLLNRLPNTVK